MTNNEIMKKLRIALDLQERDMFEIFALAEYPINKSELAAIFRKKGHKNYRPCSNEVLEKFLDGFIIRNRGKKIEGEGEEGAP
ncbi:MAG: hypothetical protein FD130_503 [Halothiobacillaceae bacterium]|nr:MAG: hypothetical protein FD130_503 [Halothiobacillaceae bacterium]